MKKLLILLLSFCSFQGFSQKTLNELLELYNTRSVPYISVEELRMMQTNEEVIILDSRELAEFEVSHIDASRHVGFTTFSSEALSEEIPNKEAAIVVYCSLGIRSEEIGEKLQKAGYSNVRNLYGGIFEWKNKTYPVLNSEEKETDSIHTFSKAWSKWLTKGIKVYQ